MSASPVMVQLKDTYVFSKKPQYPLKLEVGRGLQSLGQKLFYADLDGPVIFPATPQT